MKTRFKCVWIRSITTGHRIAVNIVTSDGQLMKRKLRSVLVNNGRNIQEIPAGLVLELLDDIKSKQSEIKCLRAELMKRDAEICELQHSAKRAARVLYDTGSILL